MRLNKKKKAIAKEPKPIYHCRFCNKDKSEDDFFKCSIQHRSFICQDCIKEKYSELNARCEKHIALFICCATLDIAFYWDIYRSLEIGQGIGYYVRHLNLVQNQNPDTFAEGVIKNNIIDYTPKDMKIDKAKAEISNVISMLDAIKNDL